MGFPNIWHVMNLIPNQRPVTPEALAAVYKVFRGNLRGSCWRSTKLRGF